MDFFLSPAFIVYELYTVLFCISFMIVFGMYEFAVRLQNLIDLVFPKARVVASDVAVA